MTIRPMHGSIRHSLLAVGAFLAAFPILSAPTVNVLLADIFLAAAVIPALYGRWTVPTNAWLRFTLIGWCIGGVLLASGIFISDVIHTLPMGRGLITGAQYMFVYSVIPAVLFGIRCSESLRRLLMAFVYGLSIAIALAVIIYLFDRELYNMFVELGVFTMKLRVGGFFNPNALAKIIALLTPFLLWNYFRAPTTLNIVIIIIFLIGLVGTRSIGGTSATVMGIAVFTGLVMRSKTVRRRLLYVGALISTALILFLSLGQGDMLTGIQSRLIQPIFTGELDEAGSLTEKLALNRDAFRIIVKSPVVGIGTDQFAGDDASAQTVHNTYLLVWAENGVLSLIGLIMLIGTVAASGAYLLLKSATRYPALRMDAALLTTTAVVFTVNLLTNTHTYSRPSVLPLILVLALVYTRVSSHLPANAVTFRSH